MHLIVPELPQTIPADPSPPDVRQSGTKTLDVRVPDNDPRGLGLLPGLHVTLVTDDGRRQQIVLGQTWTSHRRGMVLRIPYVDASRADTEPMRIPAPRRRGTAV